MKIIVLQSKVEIEILPESKVHDTGDVVIINGKVKIGSKEQEGTIRIYKLNILYTIS